MSDLDLVFVATQASGAFAMACLVLWPTARSALGILMFQLGVSLGFGAHYALLGAVGAAVVSILGAVQVIAAMLIADPRIRQIVGAGLIAVMVLAGFQFWTGLETALAIAAMSLIALGRIQSLELAMRLLIMGGGVFWMIHDAMIGSTIALAADIASLGMGLVVLTRRQRPAASVTAQA